MNGEELLFMAQKVGKAAWKGLQKITIAAAMVIAAVINGVFHIVAEYFRHKREFKLLVAQLSPEKQLVLLIGEYAKEGNRARVCWACFLTPILMTVCCALGLIDYDSMDQFGKNFMTGAFCVLLPFIFPAIFFSYQKNRLEDNIKILNAMLGGSNEE
jgi:hypothetical protein